MKRAKRLFWLSLLVSILHVLGSAFGQFVIDLVPGLGSIFILLPIDIGFLIVLVWNIFALCKNIKSKGAILRLGVQILAIVLVILSFSLGFERNVNFSMNHKARQEIIELIKAGDIKGTGTVSLPRQYKGLSKEGQIVVEGEEDQLFVRFVIYRSFPGDFEGLIYSESDEVPADDLFFAGGGSVTYCKKAPKWFWYSHE